MVTRHRSSIADRTRICPVCQGKFLVLKPSQKQRCCSHSCAFSEFGHKVLAASKTPEAIAKVTASLRLRGTGKSYPKIKGRHAHRVVMEQKLGRPLQPGEIVHHDDHNKLNYSEDNLVLTTRPEHSRHHSLGSKRVPQTICKFGHPLEGANVRIQSGGERRCIICARKYDREWKAAKRLEQEKRAT